MALQHFIDCASFEPDVLKALTQAFDEAWQDIKGNFGDDRDVVEAARLRLANALLSVATEDGRDEILKTAALQVMARDYRTRTMAQCGR